MLNTIVKQSEIRTANRLDAEYFAPKFLQLQARLAGRKFVKLHELCEFIQTGPAGSVLPASSYIESKKGFNNSDGALNPPQPPFKKGGQRFITRLTTGGIKKFPPFIKGDKGGFWDDIKIYRPSNLNGWTCDEGNFVYIAKDYCTEENYYNKFSGMRSLRSRVKRGSVGMTKQGDLRHSIKLYKARDLLITRVGDIKFGISESKEKFAISPNMMALRVKKNLLDPYFLLAFLNSDYGFSQIKRGQRRVSLSSVTKTDIGNIQIPVISIEEQVKIGRLVRSGINKEREAREIYFQAEKLLLNEIYAWNISTVKIHRDPEPHPDPLLRGEGIDKNKGILILINKIINLSKLREVRRADAEYFLSACHSERPTGVDPPAMQALRAGESHTTNFLKRTSGRRSLRFGRDDKRNKIKTVQLGQIASVLRGIEVGRVEYREKGALFLRTSNISKFGLLHKSQKYISKDLYNKLYRKYQPQEREILLVKDGKPGVACIVRKPIYGIIAEGVVRLVVDRTFSAEYICLCLNSEFCQRQIKQNIDGSLVPHLKIDQLRDLLIPIVCDEIQKEISVLVRKSGKIFEKGERDLSSAKKLIKKSMPPR